MPSRFPITVALCIAWTLSFVVLVLALFVWAQDQSWHFTHLSVYQIFPIFGLTAFSLMWVHYVVSALRQYYELPRAPFAAYYEVTGWIVLVAILLHPGLLEWQLWQDGFGLPPGSYLKHFISPELGWVALLGTVSLFVFLAFELHRFYGKRAWWRLVDWANELAMVAIFYHATRLGSELQIAWFRTVWLWYGLSLVALLWYLHRSAYKDEPKTWRLPNVIAGAIVVIAGLLAIFR